MGWRTSAVDLTVDYYVKCDKVRSNKSYNFYIVLQEEEIISSEGNSIIQAVLNKPKA